tara:strand:+ start:1395 stop:1904 length:510 start_codon:yes stop_codon:yes gene_type:complete
MKTLTNQLPLGIAKALLKITKGCGHTVAQTINVENEDENARYVATDGCSLLIVEQCLENPQLDTERFSSEELNTYVTSKGFSPLTPTTDNDFQSFPDWQQVMPKNEGQLSVVGLDLKYLKAMYDISKALKLGTRWKCTFHGDLYPTVWEPMNSQEYSKVSFVIMPVRVS